MFKKIVVIKEEEAAFNCVKEIVEKIDKEIEIRQNHA